MTSIFNIPLQETGGPTAIAAFEFQHRVAVRELLKMANSPPIEFIELDSHDDIVVKTTDYVELVQVKSKSTIWTLAELCKGENDSKTTPKGFTSIIGKQLQKTTASDNFNFRLITKSQTSLELSILTIPTELRAKPAVDILKDKMSKYFEQSKLNPSSWIDKGAIDIAGPIEAIDNHNILALTKLSISKFGKNLTPEQANEIYQNLTSIAREAASIPKRSPEKTCRREDLIEWLRIEIKKVPNFSSCDTDLLLKVFKNEIAQRCISRWLDAGLNLEKAEELFQDTQVGQETAKWLSNNNKSFLWINAPFGSGKSLCLDRHLIKVIDDYSTGNQQNIPVYIQAKSLSDSLANEIFRAASKLGDYPREGVYALIDGADELTQQAAKALIQEAAAYSRAYPDSKIIITSTLLSVNGITATPLPPLPESEILILFTKLGVKRNFYADWRLDAKLGKDASNPFFIIQKARFGFELSRARLVSLMIDAALDKTQTSAPSIENLISRIAAWQLDNGTPLIPLHLVGGSRNLLSELLQTRLITRGEESISFTIECMVHWFGALAIELKIVDIEELFRDNEKLDRWQFALSILVSKAGSPPMEAVISKLASQQPAFAGLVIGDSFLANWRSGVSKKNNIPSLEAHRMLSEALTAWKAGLEPLSTGMAILPTNNEGGLSEFSVKTSSGAITITWLKPNNRIASFWSHVIPEDPAWVWIITHRHLKAKLWERIKSDAVRKWSNSLTYEAAWEEACQNNLKSRFICNTIPLPSIATCEDNCDWLSHHLHTIKKIPSHLTAPYPQSDSLPKSAWMHEYFSLKRATERAASIYRYAIAGYKELIQTLIPKFAPRLPLYSTFPIKISGIVYVLPESPFGYWLTYSIGHSDTEFNEVILLEGTQKESDEFIHKWQRDLGNSECKGPDWKSISAIATHLDLTNSAPAFEIVKGWLKSDLESINWF